MVRCGRRRGRGHPTFRGSNLLKKYLAFQRNLEKVLNALRLNESLFQGARRPNIFSSRRMLTLHLWMSSVPAGLARLNWILSSAGDFLQEGFRDVFFQPKRLPSGWTGAETCWGALCKCAVVTGAMSQGSTAPWQGHLVQAEKIRSGTLYALNYVYFDKLQVVICLRDVFDL